MKVLYCSVHTAQNDFIKIFNECPGVENVAQKYHTLFSEGLSYNINEQNVVLSCPPVDKVWTKLYASNKYNRFFYVPIIPVKVLKHLIIYLYIFFFALFWNLMNIFQNRLIIISATQILKFMPVYVVGKLLFAKTLLITCDIPKMTFEQRVKNSMNLSVVAKIKSKISSLCWSTTQFYDYYVFLTQQMNEVVNKRNRRYVVVEGFSDFSKSKSITKPSDKYDKKIIVYAGGLFEKYGIKMLIDAVESIDDPDVELWLYGLGEMTDYLSTNNFSKTKYMGTLLNEEILEVEKKATLLINPRFSNVEYTAYSFPSKVIEYMSTGTPSIITKLKGIPDEYFDYCITITDETTDGLKRVIQSTLSLSKENLHNLGTLAADYVFTNKNNISQLQKVLDMLRSKNM